MTALDWAIWIAGGLAGIGVVGAIVLAIVAPPLLKTAAQLLAWALRQMLATRAGCAVIAAVLAGAGAGIYQHQELTAACHSEIAQLKAAAAAAGAERDREIRDKIAAEYEPVVTDLWLRKGALERQAGDYEKQLMAQLAKPGAAAGSCQLGSAALELRRQARGPDPPGARGAHPGLRADPRQGAAAAGGSK